MHWRILGQLGSLKRCNDIGVSIKCKPVEIAHDGNASSSRLPITTRSGCMKSSMAAPRAGIRIGNDAEVVRLYAMLVKTREGVHLFRRDG